VCRRELSQTDSQAGQWKYSIPQTSCSVYEWVWPGGEGYWLFSVSMSFRICSWLGVWTFFRAANRSLSGEKNCVVYSLFCIFVIIIVIIITIISSVSIYFSVVLNCVYLNPWVFPFLHFSSLSCWGGKERGELAAVWCLLASCQVKLQHFYTVFVGSPMTAE